MSGNFHRARRTVLIFLAAFLASAHASSPQEEAPAIKVEVRQVVVPVVVTDRQGHHVTGLKASDFRVFEDGVEQQVVSFGTELVPASLLPSVAPQEAEPAALLEIPEALDEAPSGIRRTYLVLIDSLFLTFQSSTRVRESLEQLFEQERDSDAHYALALLGRELKIVRGVTRRPEEILALVQGEEVANTLASSSAGSLAAQERQLISMLDEYCRVCACLSTDPPVGRPAYQDSSGCKLMLDGIEQWAAAAALERSALTRKFLRELRDIVVHMGKQPGKRILVLVSDGFQLWAGRELYGLIAVYTQRPSVYTKNPGERLGPQLEEVVRAATEGDVVIYSVDSRGLPAPTFRVFDAELEGSRFSYPDAGPILADFIVEMSRLEHARQDTMARLADATGGVFFRGNNDLARGMRQAFADGREYYVLAYVPANRDEDEKFRKIRVEVRNKKLDVRAKQGYWAPAPASASLGPAP